MAIAFRNATTAETATTVAVTNNVPSGTVDGDLLLWQHADNTSTIPTTPTGWTVAISATGTSQHMVVWWRIAASEPASYTTGTPAGGRHVGIMAAYSGVDNGTPFDVAIPAMVAGTVAVTCPAITPITTGAWVLGLAQGTVGVGVINTTYSSGNLTAIDAQKTSTNGGNTNSDAATGHFTWAAGAFTPTYTTSNATTRTLGSTIALRPAPVSGTLATTLDGATFAATGTETFTGTLATTLAGATFAASGAETFTGALATTLAGATFAGVAKETFPGVLATTLAGATFAASGTQTVPSVTPQVRLNASILSRGFTATVCPRNFEES